MSGGKNADPKIFDDNDEIIGDVGIVIDITNRRENEKIINSLTKILWKKQK